MSCAKYNDRASRKQVLFFLQKKKPKPVAILSESQPVRCPGLRKRKGLIDVQWADCVAERVKISSVKKGGFL